MWHSVTAVERGYDPIICEGDDPSAMLVLNAGPGTIVVKAWDSRTGPSDRPDMKLEVRAGSQRMVRAALIRVALGVGDDFAAVGAQMIDPSARVAL